MMKNILLILIIIIYKLLIVYSVNSVGSNDLASLCFCGR